MDMIDRTDLDQRLKSMMIIIISGHIDREIIKLTNDLTHEIDD